LFTILAYVLVSNFDFLKLKNDKLLKGRILLILMVVIFLKINFYQKPLADIFIDKIEFNYKLIRTIFISIYDEKFINKNVEITRFFTTYCSQQLFLFLLLIHHIEVFLFCQRTIFKPFKLH